MLDQSVRKGSTKSSLSQGSWVAMGNCRSGLHVCTQSCKVRPDTWTTVPFHWQKLPKAAKMLSVLEYFIAEKSYSRWQRHLLLLLRNGVGRQSQKRCDANSTQCSQAVRWKWAPHQVAPPVKRLQLLGQMLPHLSTKVSIWWIQLLLIFCYFPGFVLSWKFAHKSRSWADSCPIVFQWPWHSRGGWVYCPDLWSASLLGLLAKIKV